MVGLPNFIVQSYRFSPRGGLLNPNKLICVFLLRIAVYRWIELPLQRCGILILADFVVYEFGIFKNYISPCGGH